LYTGRQGGNSIGIFDISTRSSVGSITDTGRIDALAFGSDGLLYTGRQGGNSIGIFDISTRSSVGSITDTGRIDALAFKSKTTGKESLVNIKLTLRSKNKHYSENKTYTKEVNEEHHIGNYNFEFNDKYKRDVFFSTVAVRNMLL